MRVNFRLQKVRGIVGKQKLIIPKSSKQAVTRSNMALKASNNSSINYKK